MNYKITAFSLLLIIIFSVSGPVASGKKIDLNYLGKNMAVQLQKKGYSILVNCKADLNYYRPVSSGIKRFKKHREYLVYVLIEGRAAVNFYLESQNGNSHSLPSKWKHIDGVMLYIARFHGSTFTGKVTVRTKNKLWKSVYFILGEK